jgi:hypothetical protein
MMDRSMRSLSGVVNYCCVIGAVLLLAATFALFACNYVQSDTSFNSDHLYCIHFCDDVLHGRDIQGWHLPAAPYLFPDMVLVCVSMSLTSNLAAIFTLYQAFYYGLLLVVLFVVLRNVGLSRQNAFLIGCISLTFLLACHLHPSYVNRSLPMFHPGNHMGCLLVGLAALACILRMMRSGQGWISGALFAVVCTIAGLSDQLLIVQFLAPISITLLLLSIFRQISFLRSLMAILMMGLSTLFALKAHPFIRALGLMPMKILQSQTDRSPNWSDSLLQFGANIWGIVNDQPIMCIVFVLNLMGTFAVLIQCLRRKKHTPGEMAEVAGTSEFSVHRSQVERSTLLLLAVFFLLSPGCSVAAVLIMGSVKEAALLRYLHTCWLFPYLCLLVWTHLLPWRAARLAPWIVTAVVGFRLLSFSETSPWQRFGPPYPPLAEKLDELTRGYGRLRGVAEYWQARRMHYLTNEHVSIAPILGLGMPWFHGFNPNAYLADDPNDLTVPDYHFVIVSPDDPAGPSPEHILLRYGKPVEIIAAGGYEIWRYERLLDRQWELFLRAQLAQRLVRRKPFLSPAQPETLRSPKPNLTPWNDSRNLRVERGSSLSIRFDKIITGATIDISSNYSDQYNMIFVRDGLDVGSVRVPSVEWTGAETAYCAPGLQSRLVPVPPNCQAEGFDEVRLVPQGRSQHFCVGHFLVFDDCIPYQFHGSRQVEKYHRYEGEKLNRLESPEVADREDATASNGLARQASASYQGCMAYGPYTMLAPGRYRIDFALKVADNTSSDIVAAIDSYAFSGEQFLQRSRLRGTDFSRVDEYQIFSLTIEAEEELEMVEYRVIVPGKTTVTLDYVDVKKEVGSFPRPNHPPKK